MDQVKGKKTQEQNGYSLNNQLYQQLYDYTKVVKWVVQKKSVKWDKMVTAFVDDLRKYSSDWKNNNPRVILNKLKLSAQAWEHLLFVSGENSSWISVHFIPYNGCSVKMVSQN